MSFNKVVFCGAPLAGKTTLLQSIAEITGSGQINTRFGQNENVTRLDVSLDTLTLTCVTISGVFYHHKQSGVLNKLMRQAKMIVYVCSTVPPEKAEPAHFDLYSKEAIHYSVSWNEIPWIFVLNKIDLSNDNPLMSFIPSIFHSKIIRCAAKENIGTDLLWERIISAIS